MSVVVSLLLASGFFRFLPVVLDFAGMNMKGCRLYVGAGAGFAVGEE